MITYEKFVCEVKKKGVTYLLRETTTYPGLETLNQLYAEAYSKLVGTYHVDTGGVIHTKPITGWSKYKRTFVKVYI